MTHKGKPSPYPRRTQDRNEDTSYLDAVKAYDDAYVAWKLLVDDEAYLAACAALGDAEKKYQAAWSEYCRLRGPVEIAGSEVDRTYAVLNEAAKARMAVLTA